MIMRSDNSFFFIFFSFSFFFCSSTEIITKGENYTIYYPFHNYRVHRNSYLLSPPRVWTHHYMKKLEELSHLVMLEKEITNITSYSQEIYIQTLYNYLIGDSIGNLEKSVIPKRVYQGRRPITSFDSEKREVGGDWAFLATTMTGRVRMLSMKSLVQDVIVNRIPGDIIETGVWRGGMSIFMRGILLAHGESHRKSFVCDSFSGLPPSMLQHDAQVSWDNTRYLEISDHEVMENFLAAGIFDPEIVFVKGFFSNTMKPLSEVVTQLAILRLDGDMYESTVDVLYHLYEKLSIGGYVVIDDYAATFPARDACDDFLRVHNLSPKIVQPDTRSGYWQKTEVTKVQYWRYVEKKFK